MHDRAFKLLLFISSLGAVATAQLNVPSPDTSTGSGVQQIYNQNQWGTNQWGTVPADSDRDDGPFELRSGSKWEVQHDPAFYVAPWGSPISENAPKSAQKLFEKGYAAWLKSSFDAAEKSLILATAKYPKYARAWDVLGRLQLANGRTVEAKASFEKAEEADGKFVLPLIGQLEIANKGGETQRAVELADEIQQMAHVDLQLLEIQKTGPFKSSVSTASMPMNAFVEQNLGKNTNWYVVPPQGTATYQNFLQQQRVRMELACARAYLNGGEIDRTEGLADIALLISHQSLATTLASADVALVRNKRDFARKVLTAFLKTDASKDAKRVVRERLEGLDR